MTKNLFSRNLGYIDQKTQDQLASTRVLIAGCGIGSLVAASLARTGITSFILVDGDVVDNHNLNRQFFFHDQINISKVGALKENLLKINPSIHVEAIEENIGATNAKTFVDKVDIIIDTIDFLDLPGIVALHDEAHKQSKMLISSFSVGYGAAAMYLYGESNDPTPIRKLFQLPDTGSVEKISYIERYIELFTKIAKRLDPKVVEVMTNVFSQMAEGKVCPAPQLAIGAHEVAAICSTFLVNTVKQDIRLKSGEIVITKLNHYDSKSSEVIALI